MIQAIERNPEPISMSVPDAVPVPVEPLETVPALDRLPYLVRLGSVHALALPVIWGLALAWWQLDRLDVWVFLLSLVGAGSLYLATHDFRRAYCDHERTGLDNMGNLFFSPDCSTAPTPG